MNSGDVGWYKFTLLNHDLFSCEWKRTNNRVKKKCTDKWEKTRKIRWKFSFSFHSFLAWTFLFVVSLPHFHSLLIILLKWILCFLFRRHFSVVFLSVVFALCVLTNERKWNAIYGLWINFWRVQSDAVQKLLWKCSFFAFAHSSERFQWLWSFVLKKDFGVLKYCGGSEGNSAGDRCNVGSALQKLGISKPKLVFVCLQGWLHRIHNTHRGIHWILWADEQWVH